jgi:hypothetical protein
MIFYDVLRNLQESAKCTLLFELQLAVRPLRFLDSYADALILWLTPGKKSHLAMSPQGRWPARVEQIPASSSPAWPGKGGERVSVLLGCDLGARWEVRSRRRWGAPAPGGVGRRGFQPRRASACVCNGRRGSIPRGLVQVLERRKGGGNGRGGVPAWRCLGRSSGQGRHGVWRPRAREAQRP